MKKPVFYRFTAAMLIVCIAAQGILIVKPADVSSRSDDLCPRLCALSETAAPFLSIENGSKTRGAPSVLDGCAAAGSAGYGSWNACYRNGAKSGSCAALFPQTTSPETLYALNCQFTI